MYVISIVISVLYLAIAVLSGVYFFTANQKLFRINTWILLPSVTLHLVDLVIFAVRESKVPFTSLFEALSVVSFMLATIYLVLRFTLDINSLGLFVFPFVFVLQVISAFGPRLMYLGENFVQSPLFWFHTFTILVGYAAFAYAMIIAVMYLYLFRDLKGKKPSVMYDRLPPLELLERMNGIALFGGFIFLTVGIVLGSSLALSAWGALPIKDLKILLSLVLWVIYVFGLIAARLFHWGGKKISYFSVVGFMVLVLFMVGARFFDATFHRF